jgi:hypothetical protein
VTITGSTLAGNEAVGPPGEGQGYGGGIDSAGTLTVTASTFSDNMALGRIVDGGGIASSGTLTVANSTFSGNAADETGVNGNPFGDGIYSGGTATVTNSTLVGNEAPGSANNSAQGGALYNGHSLTLDATLLAGSGPARDCGGLTPTDDGANIDDDGSCGFTLPSITDYATLSRTLGPLAANGGPTETIALLPANPAIDYVPAPDCPPTDQRGVTRTPPCDIGAYDTDGVVAQAITFTSAAPTGATVGGPSYTVTATGGGSGNPVTFIIDSLSLSVCAIAGAVVTFTGTGTCTIDANQAGNATDGAAPQVQQSFAVTSTSSTPAPTITRLSPAKGKVGKKITIKGTNLAGALAVRVNGTAATVITDTATKITATVPAGAATGTITVTTPGGTATSTKTFKVT